MAENDKIPADEYERELATDLDDDTPDKPKGMPLHTKILLGLLVGVVGGLAVNWTMGGSEPNVVWFVSNITQPIGTLFLSMLLMIVVPLVFSSLVVGVAGIGDIRKLGRIGLKSFAYTLLISGLSVVIGLGLANLIQPGKRISEDIAVQLKEKFSSGATTAADAQKKAAESAKADSALMQAVKTVVPQNVFNSISGTSPNMIHIMFFALIVGIAITLIPTPVTATFVNFMEGVFAITSKIIDIIMKVAPYAVACLIFNNVAQFGLDLLQSLAWFVITVLLGLGYTGGAVPVDGGIVIGTDRMKKIIEISADDLYVTCQPGLTTYEVQQAVAEQGLMFAPDPASYKDSFIGGNIAENAGGMRTPKYGVTKHHVLGLEVVTGTGEVIRTGGKTVKNVVGFDLTGLMCGSEGMLGIITEATLKLLPMPEATSTVRANFHSMEAACKVLTKFTPHGLLPMAMEVIDKHCVAAIEENFAFGLSKDAGAILLVAVDGSKEEVERNAVTIERVVNDNGGFDVLRARSKEEEDKLWDVRRAISPSLMKYGTLKINEDVVVPRSKVPELVARIEEIGKRHDTFVANFGHAGDGNIHVNFVVDRDDPEAIARARECVSETFQLSVELGGTISGEHGIGYVKSQYMHYAIDRPTLEIMKGIKQVFDPKGILNPGKMFV